MNTDNVLRCNGCNHPAQMVRECVVEGINVRTRHVKPRKQGQESGILKIEAPINVSKVSYFCEKCAKGVKLGVNVSEDGKKTRVCRKCHTEIK